MPSSRQHPLECSAQATWPWWHPLHPRHTAEPSPAPTSPGRPPPAPTSPRQQHPAAPSQPEAPTPPASRQHPLQAGHIGLDLVELGVGDAHKGLAGEWVRDHELLLRRHPLPVHCTFWNSRPGQYLVSLGGCRKKESRVSPPSLPGRVGTRWGQGRAGTMAGQPPAGPWPPGPPPRHRGARTAHPGF